MWNTKNDTFGWDLNRNRPTKCGYLNKNDKCILTQLIKCILQNSDNELLKNIVIDI